ncbi:Gfo/Idh/MocA family oxidoreductase [Geodermatophilus sp. YIM 151500]|uniref:Gfo/Idh/MocA family protein n=1 Tax=Geodermatophilus sp. YIM 151500 TaxID=2984531 RepID=UPI0021E470E7|nr:Gfo/Idh/MocA family oxidoreductase [Geodermatophilus sp. YIM 151500]MCV2488899.1 Gfo/Idh/MocA family oxidoreductase [Geodermatophilus sp. YIM 151500]
MISVAVVGLGWWGRNVVGLLSGSERIRPVLGVDVDPAGRDWARSRGLDVAGDLQEALDDPRVDAVVLCSPHRFHSAQIVAAAGAGKHVFCEKPFCTTTAEADAAIAAVEAAGVRLGIGHERRFEPAVVELQELCRSGALGTPLVFEGNFSQDKFLALPPDNWRLSSTEAPVGPLSATGIHLVDLAISVFGEPSEVWARLATRATSFQNGDTLSVTLGFPDGATASITAVLTTPFIGRICVLGSRGWMEIRDRSHPENPTGWDVTTQYRDEAPSTRFVPPSPAVLDNLERFAAAVEGTAEYPVSAADIRANVRAFEAITRSALSGAVEKL